MHRVLVGDIQPLIGAGIAVAIEAQPDLQLVGAFDDGKAAMEAVMTLAPDVALLDPRLPGLDCAGLLSRLERDRRMTRVVVLAASARSDDAYRALAIGACGYASKRATGEEIADVIRRVARGDIVVDSFLGDVAAGIRMRERTPRPVLTPREHETLALIADGLSSAEIAARLHVSTATAKSHQGNLYEKLEVTERAAAVAKAFRLGLIE